MGADGGVAWAKVRGSVDRVYELLVPFQIFAVTEHSSYAEDANEEFKRANCVMLRDCVTTPYGTDCGDNDGLIDLREICNELADALQDGLETMEDVLLDVDTHPDPFAYTAYITPSRLREAPKTFLATNILDWLREVKSLVGSVQCEETWT